MHDDPIHGKAVREALERIDQHREIAGAAQRLVNSLDVGRTAKSAMAVHEALHRNFPRNELQAAPSRRRAPVLRGLHGPRTANLPEAQLACVFTSSQRRTISGFRWSVCILYAKTLPMGGRLGVLVHCIGERSHAYVAGASSRQVASVTEALVLPAHSLPTETCSLVVEQR